MIILCRAEKCMKNRNETVTKSADISISTEDIANIKKIDSVYHRY